jgi:hypothetical protein
LTLRLRFGIRDSDQSVCFMTCRLTTPDWGFLVAHPDHPGDQIFVPRCRQRHRCGAPSATTSGAANAARIHDCERQLSGVAPPAPACR